MLNRLAACARASWYVMRPSLVSSSILMSIGLPGMSRMRKNVMLVVTNTVRKALRSACATG